MRVKDFANLIWYLIAVVSFGFWQHSVVAGIFMAAFIVMGSIVIKKV